MRYRFENHEVWQFAMAFADQAYAIATCLPASEDFNVKSQLRRAASSIALNIAMGSTSQTNPEQARFVNLAIRSLIECIACLRLIQRRRYVATTEDLDAFDQRAEVLLSKLIAFRRAVQASTATVRETEITYETAENAAVAP